MAKVGREVRDRRMRHRGFRPARHLQHEELRKNGRQSGEPMDGMIAARPRTLLVNGERRELAARTLGEALRELDYGEAIVATALNGAFVPARRRDDAQVNDGDRIEIVAPRQGG